MLVRDPAEKATSEHDEVQEATIDHHEAEDASSEQDQGDEVKESSVAGSPESSTTGKSLESQPHYISPKDIRGLPVAKRQASKRKPRRKGKCMIATDTPEKTEIMQREKEQEKKQQEKEVRKRIREEKAMTKKQPAAKKKTKAKDGKKGVT